MINMREIKEPKLKTDIPGPKSKKLLELKERYVPQGVFNTVPTFIKKERANY